MKDDRKTINIGKTLYVKKRSEWRAWLTRHHTRAKEIWLIYYKKNSGKPRISYNDAVEEALCFGWIDSIVKAVDQNKYAQRYSPRKPGSQWSAMNVERLRRLMRQKKVSQAGLEAARDVLPRLRSIKQPSAKVSRPRMATDLLAALKRDGLVWENFNRFPKSYQRIRIGWIESARKRPTVFKQRLEYFLKKTAQNKRFGMVQ